MLQTYLDDTQWDLSGFVDLILGQPTVGTVIKLEDDEDNNIFSVITVLNLERYKASNLLFLNITTATSCCWFLWVWYSFTCRNGAWCRELVSLAVADSLTPYMLDFFFLFFGVKV